jgi:hypothetical protein
MAGIRFSAETCLSQDALIEDIEGALVKFLHNGDHDMIQTCRWHVPDYSGVNDFQSNDDCYYCNVEDR